MPAWTVPSTPVAATTPVSASLWNSNVRDNTLHLYNLQYDAWTSITPTLGGTGAALGNGTLVCHYKQQGKQVRGRYVILGGSTTNLSSDTLTLTLPVAARDPGDYRVPIGRVTIYDTGVATYGGDAVIDHATWTANDRLGFLYGGATQTFMNDANPIAGGFAAGDTLACTFEYEAA